MIFIRGQALKSSVNGIIIQDKELGEKDKVIRIFTAERGIISAIVKRGQSIKSKNSSLSQMLAYCRFSLFERKNGFIVDEIEVIELFWGIREDLERLALAQYFCELCMAWIPDENNSPALLRLFLNTLYYLSNKKKSCNFLEFVFELKGCSLCGYMPDLVCCAQCGNFNLNEMVFFIRSGKLLCKKCVSNSENSLGYSLTAGVLCALRHIIYSDWKELFNFSVSHESEIYISKICEEYIFEHIGTHFKSLDFYRKLNKLST